jgi:hypothetical protein
VDSRPVPSTAGISVLDCFKSLREVVGDAAVDQGVANVGLDVRREFEALTPLSWFPNTSLNVLIDSVAAAAGVDPEPMLDAAVRLAVQRTFKTVWRMFLRVTTDGALITRTPLIYARSRNIGQLTARVVTPGISELTLTGWPDITPRQIRTIGISIEEVVRIAGRRDVTVTSVRTPDGAQYRLTWRA